MFDDCMNLIVAIIIIIIIIIIIVLFYVVVIDFIILTTTIIPPCCNSLYSRIQFNVMEEYFVFLWKVVFITEGCNITVNSDEFIGKTEYPTL